MDVVMDFREVRPPKRANGRTVLIRGTAEWDAWLERSGSVRGVRHLLSFMRRV